MQEKYDFKKTDNIRVIARFRPANETEKREEKIQGLEPNDPKFRSIQECVLKNAGNAVDRQAFKAVLDHIFRMSVTQKKIFDLVGRPMVQAVLEGYNATIFAYGQTGSGKTFTMFGPEKRKTELHLGLVQRCCTYLFDKLRKLTQGVSAEVVEWQVGASFIQIYKEHLSDLLEPSSRALRIRTNFQTDTPYVENLKTVSVNNIEDVLIHLGIAFSNRIVASHKLNSTSSRSHMLLMLNVEQKTRDGAVKRSKLNFGDLAGSEDIRKALGSDPDPERMKEAIAINSSLTALTTAIHNLSKGQRPSYRSSALTHMLQDSLGGNSKTTMIVAASPHVMNRSETIRTLRFAMTAKTVKNKAKINKELTKSQLMRRIEELEAMNAKLKARVIELETQMQAAGLEVELSTELYQVEADDNDWSSAEDDDEDFGANGGKKKRKKKGVKGAPKGAATGSGKKGKKGKKNKSGKGGARSPISHASTQQIEMLKKEIDASNERAKNAQTRNAELEKRTLDLAAEIDGVTQQLQSSRETMDEMSKRASNFAKERQLLESRNEDIQRELTTLQTASAKQAKDIDRQIARQRNNLGMKQQENKELQKFVKELNLQNEELLKQNDLLTRQMVALKREAYKANPELAASLPMDDETLALVKELDGYVLSDEESKMAPADLLLNRFAASEANDFRLSSEQRMKKTAKMMTDMSDDINDLMGQWLPKKRVRSDRIRSKTLVFQVRQLIGHFNVLVKQMKSTEDSFQNDLKLDIRRRDNEIKKLKNENKLVHQLQDDLQEKDEMMEALKKHRDDLRVERDHLKAQTVEQQDMIFDVQNQVRYLNTELERNRSTIVELKMSGSKRDLNDSESGTGTQGVIDLLEILDGDEPPSSDSGEESDSEEKVDKYNKSGKAQKLKGKHAVAESAEIMYMSDEEEEENEMNGKGHGGGTGTIVIHDEVSDEEADEEAEEDEKQSYEAPAPPSQSAAVKKRKKVHRRKSTMSMWRESLKPNDQLDCKDESGLWWTAKVVGYKNNNSDKLQIRYDGWGDQYDEIIDRESDRLAVYKSMFHSKDKGGKKLIREGFMSKEGKMFKTWRKRYFTLNDKGKLAYYHNEGDENPIGSVDMRAMKKTERATFGRNKQFGVQIHTETRVWKFLCQNEKDLAEWIHAFNFVRKGEFRED